MVAFSLFLLFVILFGVFCFLLIATMSYLFFAGYFLVHSLLSVFPVYLRMYYRFDMVWFRLSRDHDWIGTGDSGSVCSLILADRAPSLVWLLMIAVLSTTRTIYWLLLSQFAPQNSSRDSLLWCLHTCPSLFRSFPRRCRYTVGGSDRFDARR